MDCLTIFQLHELLHRLEVVINFYQVRPRSVQSISTMRLRPRLKFIV